MLSALIFLLLVTNIHFIQIQSMTTAGLSFGDNSNPSPNSDDGAVTNAFDRNTGCSGFACAPRGPIARKSSDAITSSIEREFDPRTHNDFNYLIDSKIHQRANQFTPLNFWSRLQSPHVFPFVNTSSVDKFNPSNRSMAKLLLLLMANDFRSSLRSTLPLRELSDGRIRLSSPNDIASVTNDYISSIDSPVNFALKRNNIFDPLGGGSMAGK